MHTAYLKPKKRGNLICLPKYATVLHPPRGRRKEGGLFACDKLYGNSRDAARVTRKISRAKPSSPVPRESVSIVLVLSRGVPLLMSQRPYPSLKRRDEYRKRTDFSIFALSDLARATDRLITPELNVRAVPFLIDARSLDSNSSRRHPLH